MKRRLIVLLCTVFLFGMISGCSTKDVSRSDDNQITLKYWTLFGGGDAKFMREIVNKFNQAHSNIQVDYIQFAFDDYYTKLVTGIAAGRAPDIAVSHITRLPQLVKLDIVSSIDSLAKKVNLKWNTFNQNNIDAATFANKHYAVPIDTHPFVMYYNKEYLRAAGLLNEQGKPIVKNTPTGFVQFLTTLKKKSPNGVAPLAIPTTGDDAFNLWWTFYHQLGGDGVLSDDLTSANIDLDKAIRAANYLKDLYYKHDVVPLNLSDYYQTFQSEKAAVFISGVWTTGTWESTKGLDFGVTPIPTIFEEKAVWGDSHTLILPKHKDVDQERRKAALTFAKFVAKNGQIWAEAGHIPAKQTVFDKKEYKQLPYRSDYKQASNHVAFPKRSVNNAPVKNILIRNLDTVLNGSASAEMAFKKAEGQINELLDNALLTEE